MESLALLVEGKLDEAVGHHIVHAAGGRVSVVYGKRGVDYVRDNIKGFNDLAQGTPILALADLMDTRFNCPARVVTHWLPHQNENMLLRLVVREVESWLLADRANAAQFLGVSKTDIPRDPENLEDPKRRVVNLARESQHRKIRELLVPEEGISASEGPGYTSEMRKFVRDEWCLNEAMEGTESLARCVTAVSTFFEEQKG